MKPLIVKMDNALSTLKKCKQLRMSSNAIEKIEGLNEVADTLEQLWISYNQIASFAGIEKLVNLQVLYASNNKIDKWPEVERLQTLPKLRELNLVNNPIFQKSEAEGNWRIEVIKRLEKLKSLDGSLIEDEEREQAKAES